MVLIGNLHLKFVINKIYIFPMKRILFLFITIITALSAQSQLKPKANKYPSLLWEITGNGVSRPSYLFGTMHVSSKIAFHLADSFYIGIRNADMVALETNPESWQEDMSKYDLESMKYSNSGRRPRYGMGNYSSMPSDYLTIGTLEFFKYEENIERSLYSNPSTINNFLYRSYGNQSSDFEEDTYLDMYIYQCGKRWGKKVAGVENYAESMRLMQEAYRDAAKEKNKKERNYDVDEDYSIGKLQEAYRKGNLDQLDSINKLNSFSDAFDEKFMYRRNEIQASSIDSILRSGNSLFVGVGAAHLPGERGVIEMLRAKGYKLRPIKMGERDSQHKEQVEKIRVQVKFNTESAEDGFFKVDIPGKFFKFNGDGPMDQRQYADMANGSYYMVTRIATNAWMWGHNSENVYRTIDSLLYENIPGKIVSKSKITKNGYTGFDITNRTRRGDIQRYNIFITPFEVIIFKMGGNDEYVKDGVEAQRFFGSIQLKEYKTEPGINWKKYSPPYGGFSIDLPHEPYISNDGSWIYDAEDRQGKTNYRIIRTDVHNYHFVEEDTFDLGLMAESFASSEFIDTMLARKQGNHKGYPSLDCKYRTKSGVILSARFIIQGPHYYTLVAGSKDASPRMQQFLNSFEITPFVYGETKTHRDTSLYYSVQSPVIPETKKERLDIPRYFGGYSDDDDDDESEKEMLEDGAYRSSIISNDSTGERVYVSFYKYPRYYFAEDRMDADITKNLDSMWIVKSKKTYKLADSTKVAELVLSDTGSSRTLISKTMYKNGLVFSLETQLDSLSKPSAFINSFFSTFKPADTLKGINIYEKKSSLLFADLMSADTVAHKRAVKNIDYIYIDSTDLPVLKKAINWLTWDKKKYLEIKKDLIRKLEDINTIGATDYLKELYYNAGDTVELQYVILETMLQQQTQCAFNVFKDIVTSEPPVLAERSRSEWSPYTQPVTTRRYARSRSYDNSSFLDELTDSLKLTRTIFPDLLPLLNLDDYERAMMGLLARLIDSNLVKPKDYEMFFTKFLIEAKQELKKQVIAEKRRAIKKAEESKDDKAAPAPYYVESNTEDKGNMSLSLYATILLPYWDINPNVRPVINQMLGSNDKRLKYNTMMLLLRNGKPVHDSLLDYFAGLDEFRYELYTDLTKMKKANKFPAKYNNHIDLGRSCLYDIKMYSKPDTIAYVDRLPATVKGKKGFIYFFKYRNKKDEGSWKLATVGLVPEDPKKFELDISDIRSQNGRFLTGLGSYDDDEDDDVSDFTDFLEVRIKDDEPLKDQLNRELRKKLYSVRKSAREFYDDDSDNRRYDMPMPRY